MIRFVFIILFLLTATRQTYGQVYYIDLRKQTLALENRDFYVSKVIDARSDKSNAGWVQRGLTNTRVSADFENGLTTDLMKFFTTNFPYQAGQKPIIVKVLQLRVSEKTGAASETATAELVVDFIHPSEGTYLPAYYSFAVVKSRGLDVTSRHNDNVTEALRTCFEQLIISNWTEHLDAANAMSWEEVIKDHREAADTLQYPILTDQELQTGIYQNFLEFRNNTPGITRAFTVATKKREGRAWEGTYEIDPYYVEEDGRQKPVKHAWGFVYGDNLYINHLRNFYLLERIGNRFSFYAPSPPDPTAVYTGGLVGGLVGSMVAASATSGRKIRYELDMITGEVSPYGTNLTSAERTFRGKAKVVMYYWADKSSDAAPIPVVLTNQSDSLSNQVLPNTYLEFEWTGLQKSLQVCIPGQTDTPCLTFMPKLNQTYYFACAGAGKNGAKSPALKLVESKEAEFYLKRIRYARELEEKRNRR